MKKTLLIAAVAGLAMVSCKKDRTCTCTVTETPVSGASTTSSYEVTLKEVKKSHAKDGMCSAGSIDQMTAPVSGDKTEVTCELK